MALNLTNTLEMIVNCLQILENMFYFFVKIVIAL